MDAILKSKKKYIVIYPNNDTGNEFIIAEYKRFKEAEDRFRIFPSIRFEYFLTLMKHANFIIGNSSAGIREAGVYGIPALDIGTRQKGRYSIEDSSNILHVEESSSEILRAINKLEKMPHEQNIKFGQGDSALRFMKVLREDIWSLPLQKKFVDLE